MIADMVINKRLNPIVTELFITGKKLNGSLFFITQYYLEIPKDFRLNCTHSLLQELQLIGFNNLSDTDYEDFINIYKKITAKLYSFFLTDTTFASDNPLYFRKNLLERI